MHIFVVIYTLSQDTKEPLKNEEIVVVKTIEARKVSLLKITGAKH